MKRINTLTQLLAATLPASTLIAASAGPGATSSTATSLALSLMLFMGLTGFAFLSFVASKLLAPSPERSKSEPR